MFIILFINIVFYHLTLFTAKKMIEKKIKENCRHDHYNVVSCTSSLASYNPIPY